MLLQSLLHLDISSNEIGDQAGGALVQCCTQLTKLELRAIGLSHAGLPLLASQLSSSSCRLSLKSLDLSRNAFSESSVDMLCAAISSNTQLQSIKLCNCHLGNSSGMRILKLVQSLKHSEAVSHRHHELQVFFAQTRMCHDSLYMKSK
jgi:Ran GTPase-activating protein (RanGAP) involved in mRNA processing and transport